MRSAGAALDTVNRVARVMWPGRRVTSHHAYTQRSRAPRARAREMTSQRREYSGAPHRTAPLAHGTVVWAAVRCGGLPTCTAGLASNFSLNYTVVAFTQAPLIHGASSCLLYAAHVVIQIACNVHVMQVVFCTAAAMRGRAESGVTGACLLGLRTALFEYQVKLASSGDICRVPWQYKLRHNGQCSHIIASLEHYMFYYNIAT